jgi:putative membrane protein
VVDPAGDDEYGDEPDYRFTLANERTFLAWVRTSLALLAGGVAVREFVEPFDIEGGRRALAIVAIASSAVCVVLAYRRWAAAQAAMRRGEPLPTSPAIPLVTGAMVVLAVGAGMLVIFG